MTVLEWMMTHSESVALVGDLMLLGFIVFILVDVRRIVKRLANGRTERHRKESDTDYNNR